ncbi:MAG TPA: ribokinase [Dehalococcoidia bacterium]
MVKIVVLASFNMDLVMRAGRRPEAGETLRGEFAMHLGGKGFNQAVAARRLGADVTVVGRVGDDEFGRKFLDALDAEGIDRRFVAVDRHQGTGVASIVVEPDGTNTIVQAPRANLHTTADDIDRELGVIGDADIAMFQLELPNDAVLAFARKARASGVPVIFNPAPAVPFDKNVWEHVDVCVANEIEAAQIEAGRPANVEVVRTLGSAGASWQARSGQGHEPAFAVDAVDTTGAGDAFCGAFAVRLGEQASFADAVSFANAAGALACTRHGAYPSMPRRDDVETLLAKGVHR